MGFSVATILGALVVALWAVAAHAPPGRREP